MGNILDKENKAFRNMIASMVNSEDHVTLPYKHGLTHATDNILAVANPRVGNFHPAVLDPYTLWNADELYIRTPIESAAAR